MGFEGEQMTCFTTLSKKFSVDVKIWSMEIQTLIPDCHKSEQNSESWNKAKLDSGHFPGQFLVRAAPTEYHKTSSLTWQSADVRSVNFQENIWGEEHWR